MIELDQIQKEQILELNQNQEKLAEYQKFAEELVAQMTLEEKCSQMIHTAAAVERLGISQYNWWNEALHGVARAGVATVFPQAITMAASFDEELIEEVADAIATEGRAKFNNQQKYQDYEIYKGLTFWSPNVNIFRDPRWGRGHETFGEDPYLTSRLGVRFIKGLQGHDKNYLKAAACAKHFAVHSGPEDLRHEFNAEVSNTDLYETYLPAFRACVIEGKVEAVMGAYNRTNGVPCCGNQRLLQEILRTEWGFEGHVVSDCWAIRDFYQGHGVVEGPVEAVAMAVKHGCDLNCGSLFLYLQEAVEKGLVSEEQVDRAVVHLLTSRIKLGLLGKKEENPYDAISFLEADSHAMQELNTKTALKSVVLLKNQENLLPLNPKAIQTIGVIGPNANSRKALVGNYEGTASRYITVLEGIQDYLGDQARVLFSEGCHLYKERINGRGIGNDRLAEVKGICEHSDVIICCMGLDAGLEGEQGDKSNQFASGDKPDLNLPGVQEEVLRVAVESGKPVVLVLLSGSALAITYAEEKIPAILYAGYPGAQGGKAIAKILFGENCPEGKLPITFYRSTEELPEFTDYTMKNRTYRYMKTEALYPFGYGLSYTRFALQKTKLSSLEVTAKGILVETEIANIGEYDGAETIQVYVKVEQEDAPYVQLKGLQKVFLQKGEKKQVCIQLTEADFGLYGEDCKKQVIEGVCRIYVGTSQPDARSCNLKGEKPEEFLVRVLESRVVEEVIK